MRCIKPNQQKVPNRLEGSFVERQMRYTGVSAVTEIYRVGYPVSLLKLDFPARYACLAFQSPAAAAAAAAAPLPGAADELCRALLALAAPQGGWVDASHRAGPHVQIGRTKVFMREATARQLEVAREEAMLAHRAVHPA